MVNEENAQEFKIETVCCYLSTRKTCQVAPGQSTFLKLCTVKINHQDLSEPFQRDGLGFRTSNHDMQERTAHQDCELLAQDRLCIES